jgi:hypothetical protein
MSAAAPLWRVSCGWRPTAPSSSITHLTAASSIALGPTSSAIQPGSQILLWISPPSAERSSRKDVVVSCAARSAFAGDADGGRGQVCLLDPGLKHVCADAHQRHEHAAIAERTLLRYDHVRD